MIKKLIIGVVTIGSMALGCNKNNTQLYKEHENNALRFKEAVVIDKDLDRGLEILIESRKHAVHMYKEHKTTNENRETLLKDIEAIDKAYNTGVKSIKELSKRRK